MPSNSPLILASTSRYRRALLERLGLPFEVQSSGVDEDAWKTRGLSPRELAEQLALAKARVVAEQNPSAVVIGGDQVPAIDDSFLDKPETVENAIKQLRRLSGRAHELITAIAVIGPFGVRAHTDCTRLTMRSLSDEEIHRYVLADSPLDCAGAYRIESRGITLFERIESQDHTSIEGIPLIALTTILRDLNFVLP